ncbi:hypothetical protein R1sor_018802 [Riccia sorocarpa]|uniref:Uncharacterized protein n=1 Tax=Riccia sorocarpa TaxID=122646 RepID=A0ABD3IEA2_9MARC
MRPYRLRKQENQLLTRLQQRKQSKTECAPEGPIQKVAETAANVHLSESPKKGAKIHDFCLGIPYGLFWLILTGSTAAIRYGVIHGGVLLFLSITDLKIWKQGRSYLPYIKGQADLAAIIFIRDSRRYLGVRTTMTCC